MRLEHQIILDLIEPESRVLDLGCGDGTLLAHLVKEKGCHGTGLEIDEKMIYECIAKGVSVSHGNIDTGLDDYSDQRFDYVILQESLQQVLHPKNVILESLRVGKKAIVSIPNFCHISARWQMVARGRVPVTAEMPDQWYETPNLRFLSLKDFRDFCEDQDIIVVTETGIHASGIVRFLPNLFAKNGIFVLKKNAEKNSRSDE